MAALVMLVLLVCACSLFCELFQRRLEEVVPLAACAIVLMMYAFALAGLLRAGALAALGAVCRVPAGRAGPGGEKTRPACAFGAAAYPGGADLRAFVPGVAGSERGQARAYLG